VTTPVIDDGSGLTVSSLVRTNEAWRGMGQGFVRQGQSIFLFVTLDKTEHVEAFQYKDHFLSPSEFEWQSQNRTNQGWTRWTDHPKPP